MLTGWSALEQSLAEGPPVLAAVLARLDVGRHWARPGGLVGAIAAVASEVLCTAALPTVHCCLVLMDPLNGAPCMCAPALGLIKLSSRMCLKHSSAPTVNSLLSQGANSLRG